MPTRDIYGNNGPLNDMEEAERIEQMKKEQEQRTSAPVVTATPAATQTQTAAPTTATEQPTRRGMDAFLSYLQGEIDKRRAESDEERKKREKREKTQAVIAGIADIGSAIGNMVHAYHGGKSTFDPTQGMSPRYKELWEKNKAEREKMAAERMNYMRMKDSLERQKAADEENKRRYDALQAQKEQEKREKKEEAEDLAYITPLMYDVANEIEKGVFDEEAWRKRFTEELKDNPRRMNKAMQALENTAAKTRYAVDSAARKSQQRVQEATEKSNARSTGGKGGGSDQYTYIGFGDGGGVNIRKNDKDAIKAAYDKLPDSLKRYSDKQTEYEQKVRAYLISNPNTPEAESIKKDLRQTSKRQQKPTQSGKRTYPAAGSNTTSSGKKTYPNS